MIDRIYDPRDGVYLGVIFEPGDGYFHAEDRVVVAWRHKSYDGALAWLRTRRALTIGNPARKEIAA